MCMHMHAQEEEALDVRWKCHPTKTSNPEGLAGLVCELRGAEQSYNGSLLLQTGIRCGRG